MIEDYLHIDWAAFHFLRPGYLWLLLPLALALVVGVVSIRDQIKWKKSIAPHLRSYVIQKGNESILIWMRMALFAMLAFAILGSAGPTWKKVEIPGQILETPVVIALDLSQSMMARDIQPSRLERAKFKIIDLLDANPRARIALVGFAGTAHTIIPLAQDYNIIKSHLDGLSPNAMPFPGSDLSSALVMTDSITSISEAPATLIVFTDDFTEVTFNHLKQFANAGKTKVELVPMNTIEGADVPRPGSRQSMKNQSGEIIHSALDLDILNKLKAIDNIQVHQLTLDKSDMEALASNIRTDLKFQEADEEKKDDWIDYGIWLVIPFALFTLMWFRKGFVVYSIVILLGMSSCQGDFSMKNSWITKDYQAQQLYDQGSYDEAASLYTDPMHKGVADFKAGNYELAIEAFNEDATANGAYNLGLAYYKNGDYAAANMAFGKAIELNPELKDAEKNQALVQQLIAGTNKVKPEDAKEATSASSEENIQNKDPEDLGGGGQEATDEEMEKERKEENVATDMRTGKELDEVPDDFESGKQDGSQKMLMRKVDDDPSLFLKRKFAYQAKKYNLKPSNPAKKW